MTELDGGPSSRPVARSTSASRPADPHRQPTGILAVRPPLPRPCRGHRHRVRKPRRSVASFGRFAWSAPGRAAAFNPDGVALRRRRIDGRLGSSTSPRARWSGPQDPVHSGPISCGRRSLPMAKPWRRWASMASWPCGSGNGVARARAQPVRPTRCCGWLPPGRRLRARRPTRTVRRPVRHRHRRRGSNEACRVAGRNLTETEWRDAFGDRPYRETCATT